MPRLTLPTRIASAAIVHQSVPLFTGTVGSRPRTSPPALTKVLCSWVRLEFSRRPVPIWAGAAAGSRYRRFPTAAHLSCRNTPPGLGSKRSSPDIPFAKGCIGQESDGLATGLPNCPGPRPFRFQGYCGAQGGGNSIGNCSWAGAAMHVPKSTTDAAQSQAPVALRRVPGAVPSRILPSNTIHCPNFTSGDETSRLLAAMRAR